MPRRPRIIVEGAIYHVYNRIARGEAVFAEPRDADLAVELLRHVVRRDGFSLLAWCLMPNHVHLAVRIGAVPLARSMAHVQARLSMQHNRRLHSSGPLWQSRYKAKLVTDPTYLLQLIAYIHLNPVSAGLVAEPSAYAYSGHRELLGRPGHGLLEPDGVLALFGTTVKAARRSYRELLRACAHERWAADEPGRLPWWSREIDRALEAEPLAPRLDPLGRAAGRTRARLEPREFVRQACEALGVPAEKLLGGTFDRAIVGQRQLVAGLAVERWRIRAGALARLFGRRPEVVTRWAKRAGERRVEDPDFHDAFESLDASLAVRTSSGGIRSVKSDGPGT